MSRVLRNMEIMFSSTNTIIVLFLITILFRISSVHFVCSQLDEDDRVKEYYARGHTWPPKSNEFIPSSSPKWRKIYSRRLSQIAQMENLDEKYNAYMSTVYSGLIAPTFSEYGWGVTRAPKTLVDKIRKSFFNGLVKSPELENDDRAIEGQTDEFLKPLWVELELNLYQEALETLRPILESWSQTSLTPNNAYGLRVYRNESIMNMHVDNAFTHIISCILHIDHDPMSVPWPLVIEDYQGNTAEVTLDSGDVLLYESSKCLHGRPIPFNGSWYTSLFLHFYPKSWDGQKHVMDVHFRIPDKWYFVRKSQDDLEALQVIDTSFKEPSCHLNWCALTNTTKYAGPGKEGKVLTPLGWETLINSQNENENDEEL